ncbi:MAG: hypothetical protein AAGI49_20315 [Bacteroidota bacterium]
MVQTELISIFKNHGVPRCIKVDNGRPFGDPLLETVPPLALWLVGLGIKVIWNPPATPQDNAKVERNQGVMAKWTDFANCKNAQDLQMRLWKEAEFYNYHFPIRRLGHQKRIEIFPKLAHTTKEWNPADFKLNRVFIFLAKGAWQRKVSSSGQISLYAQRFSVGIDYKHQIVSIKLDAKKRAWVIFDANGKQIRIQKCTISYNALWNIVYS